MIVQPLNIKWRSLPKNTTPSIQPFINTPNYYPIMPKIDDKYYLLKELEKEDGQSQRNLANQLGFSLGKINFLIKALVEVGIIKIDNFAHNKNKTQYSYILTPKGISEKVKITKAFIVRKETEYVKIQLELEEAKKTMEE